MENSIFSLSTKSEPEAVRRNEALPVFPWNFSMNMSISEFGSGQPRSCGGHSLFMLMATKVGVGEWGPPLAGRVRDAGCSDGCVEIHFVGDSGAPAQAKKLKNR